MDCENNTMKYENESIMTITIITTKTTRGGRNETTETMSPFRTTSTVQCSTLQYTLG
jgi:hypothetical protein